MKQFMNLQKLLFPWELPQQLPLCFAYGDKTIRGIPENWHPEMTVREAAPGILETAVTATSPEGLELKVVCKRYSDYAAVEIVGFFTNLSDTDSPLLQDIRFTGDFPGHNATLYHGNGDTWLEDGYEWWYTSLAHHGRTLSPIGDGTSCNGAFPYMRLLFENCGVNIAVGWSGTWIAEFAQKDGAVQFSSGQKRCHMVIHPGETMRLPSLTLVAYEGKEDAGRNTWRHFYFDHIMPKQNGKPLGPKCCMHLFGAQGKPEFTGATEENQLTALHTYLEKGIKPDLWWIDAGWYPCDFEWNTLGNWYPNPQHFPNGLKPIGDACKQHGMDFLLWFEPERVRPNTRFYREHPHWLLHYTDDNGEKARNMLTNLAEPACCDFMIDLLDGIIKESGVTVYRQDLNGGTTFRQSFIGRAWRENEAADRIGALENLHIQGYYRMWDSLLQRNPGLLIDSCASGGRRNDIETMRRSVPLHYTDVGYGNYPIKLKQHRQMFEWIPYFRAHNKNWWNDTLSSCDYKERQPDKYAYYVAMTPALTDVTECDDDEQAFALARQMQALWRKAAPYMLGTDYYPLTECRRFAEDFYAAQFIDSAAGAGIVHMVNGAAATKSEFILKLKGLDAAASYRMTSAEEKRSWTATGAQLMEGFSVVLPKKSGDIWFFEKEE